MGRARIPYKFEYTGDTPLHLRPGAQTVPVDRIIPRPGKPTRELRAIHVLAVAESIAVLGLLEPPILDTLGRLLAGAHRVAAMFLLTAPDKAALRSRFLGYTGYNEPAKSDKASDIGDLLERVEKIDPKGFHARYPGGKVPVYVVEVNEKNPEFHALSIETTENSVRRQYTPDEVQGLFERLVEAGFIHKKSGGRPKTDDKTAVAALRRIIGKSDSQVRRMLKGTAKLEKSEWDAAVASFIRAAQRVKRASAEGMRKASDAGAILRAAEATLNTASGKRMRRHQAFERETSPSA